MKHPSVCSSTLPIQSCNIQLIFIQSKSNQKKGLRCNTSNELNYCLKVNGIHHTIPAYSSDVICHASFVSSRCRRVQCGDAPHVWWTSWNMSSRGILVSGPYILHALRSNAATICFTTSSKNTVANCECSSERNSNEIWGKPMTSRERKKRLQTW